MITIGLYINGVRADMYENQTVQIKDSIKKASDVGGLFTQYTRPFKLPASKTNNIIFQHWHSLKLSDGFDARKKQDAIITLNGADYKKGYIKLIDVELQNNEAKTYNIQFFGELTTLKDRMGNDILPDLDYLDRFEHAFDVSTVRSGFEGYLKYDSTTDSMVSNASEGEIAYPFISHTTAFQYDNTGGLSNINSVTPSSPLSSERLTHTDLKPAVRLSEIIAAIEDKYDLDFQGDFFNNDVFTELFMWCHRYKGGIKTDDPLTNTQIFTQTIQDAGALDSFTKASDDPLGYSVEVHDQQVGTGQATDSDWDKYMDINNNYIAIDPDNEYDFITYNVFSAGGFSYTNYDVQLQITPDSTFTADYTVRILNTANGNVYATQTITGGNNYDSGTITLASNLGSIDFVNLGYEISSNGLDQFDVDWNITANREHPSSNGSRARSWVYSDTVISAELITEAKVKFNMPKMKVIDFLRGLFKMFNLVAYQEKNLSTGGWHIFVEPYQQFLENGLIRDITDRVDITSTKVERITPFKEITFDYEDKNTYLAKKTDELSKFDFGSLKWTSASYGQGETQLYDGGSYKVMLPFEKMVYERILDSNSDATEIMYGWFVNDFEENTPEPETGKPLIFYLNKKTISSDTITWADGGTTGGGDTYNAPSNIKTDGTQTLNFNAEYDEYTYLTNEESLFKNFYSDFIGSVYDITSRRYRVTAYLTHQFMWNYKLNDKIVINSVPFNIQEITADLSTGKANLDLLKITSKIEAFETKETYDKYGSDDYVDDGYWGEGYNELDDDETSSSIPIVNYNFNNSFNDSSALFNETELEGTETYVTDVNGNILISLNGITYLECKDGDNAVNFAGDVPFTLHGRLLFDSLDDKEVLASKINLSDFQFSFYKTASNELSIRLYTDSSNYIGVKSTNTFSSGTLYNVSMTYDGSETEAGLNLYIDGVAETSVSDSLGVYTGFTSTALNMLIGAQDANSPVNLLKGDIDTFKIFNAELTAEEIALL